MLTFMGAVIQTDAALIALGRSHSIRGYGLKSLSLAASIDLTDAGLTSYVVGGISVSEDMHCSMPGSSLTTLVLSSCGGLSPATLQALATFCPNIVECTLKDVDCLFRPTDDFPDIGPIWRAFIDSTRIHTLTLAVGSSKSRHSSATGGLLTALSLPDDFFAPFANLSSTLRRLNLSASPALRSIHLAALPTVTRLTTSGTTALHTQFDFAGIPNLRRFSQLGEGFTIRSLHSMLRCCTCITSITIDSGSHWTQSSPSQDVCNVENAPFCLPAALEPYALQLVASSHLPSWALAYLLAQAPPSLESFTLSGFPVHDASPRRRVHGNERRGSWFESWLVASDPTPARRIQHIPSWRACIGNALGLPSAITGYPRRRSSADSIQDNLPILPVFAGVGGIVPTVQEASDADQDRNLTEVPAPVNPAAGLTGAYVSDHTGASKLPALLRRATAYGDLPRHTLPSPSPNGRPSFVRRLSIPLLCSFDASRRSSVVTTRSEEATLSTTIERSPQKADLLDLLRVSRTPRNADNNRASVMPSRLSPQQRDWLDRANGGTLLRVDA